MTKRIVFIGAGNMASSLIGGLIADGVDKAAIAASDPNEEQRSKLSEQFDITTYASNDEAIDKADVVVLAVKPQIMAAVCEEIASFGLDLSQKLFISIAAGISIARLQGLLGKINVVRTMPNTPALIQQGMTGLYADTSVSEEDRQTSSRIMSAVGKTLWVDSEEQINAITAASGSAPAYFFLFMEAMADYATQLGFTPEQARTLVEQSALGSAQLVAANPDTPIATLRANVTSKGGTTAQALRVFEEQGLRDIVAKAMQAATDRSAEMEKLF